MQLGRSLAHDADFKLRTISRLSTPTLGFDFLAGCAELYTLAVWSSGGSEYVEGIVEKYLSRPSPAGFCVEQKSLHAPNGR